MREHLCQESSVSCKLICAIDEIDKSIFSGDFFPVESAVTSPIKSPGPVLEIHAVIDERLLNFNGLCAGGVCLPC